jgi:AcrR family transcriptional regulator
VKVKANGAAEAVAQDLPRSLRPDAQRSVEALLQAAKEVFATSGVDAPIREIAGKAGLGVGTVYRHFPQRSDLIAAVFRREIDACADAAKTLSEQHDAFDALSLWMQRFSAFFATKRGLAGALHSGDAAYEALPGHFELRLRPALQSLLTSATAAGQIRNDIAADELLAAVAGLSMAGNTAPGQAQRMVALLSDGLRRRDAG